MNKSNSLIKRLIVLASSILLFYIFLSTKFLVDNTQDITSDVILIIIVVVIYMMFVKYVKKLVLEDLYSYLFSLCLISSLTIRSITMTGSV